MNHPVDLRNLQNAVTSIAQHIPSVFPVKILRLIAVWICYWLGSPLFLFQELVVVNDTFDS